MTRSVEFEPDEIRDLIEAAGVDLSDVTHLQLVRDDGSTLGVIDLDGSTVRIRFAAARATH